MSIENYSKAGYLVEGSFGLSERKKLRVKSKQKKVKEKSINHSGDQHSVLQHMVAHVGNPAGCAHKQVLLLFQVFFVDYVCLHFSS